MYLYEARLNFNPGAVIEVKSALNFSYDDRESTAAPFPLYASRGGGTVLFEHLLLIHHRVFCERSELLELKE